MPRTKSKTKFAIALLSLLVIVSIFLFSNRGDHEARAILQKSIDTYAHLSSYRGTGRTIEVIGTNHITGSFSISLARPDFYRVDYEQRASTYTNRGAVWFDGTNDFFANKMRGQTVKMPFRDPWNNLGDIVEVSGGATASIPALFFKTQIPPMDLRGRSPEGALVARFLHMIPWVTRPIGWNLLIQPAEWSRARLVKEPDAKINGVDCYVISARTDGGDATLWIGKSDSLIHQSRQNVRTKLPEATDAEISTLLAGIPGLPPLPPGEMKNRINDARKEATATGKPVTVIFSTNTTQSGLNWVTVNPPDAVVYTQTQDSIAVNEKLSPADLSQKQQPGPQK